MDKLTSTAKKLLCKLYKSYLEKCKSGLSKTDANRFNSCECIHNELVPTWIFSDVENACRELNQKNFIHCSWYDNTGFNISLTSDAISILENRFKNNVKSLLSFIADIK